MHLSVALCTYNGARYLPEQLASIARQTRLPNELVLCDDGSQDTTLEMLEAFAGQAPFTVRVHRNSHNLGSTKNFEQAIRLCEGDVIALADQDDYWYPNKLARIEAAFSHDAEAGFVFSNADVVDGERQKLGYTLWQSVRFTPAQQQQVNRGQATAVLLRHPVVTGATMAFRSSFRDLVLPIGEGWIHDEWIAFLIAAQARAIAISEPLMQYRRHDTNQVGAEDVKATARLRTALQTDPTVYRRRAQQYRVLNDHIAERMPEAQALRDRLWQKQAHLTLRGTLPQHGLLRILPVLRECLRGGYTYYSGSLLNAVRDLMLRQR